MSSNNLGQTPKQNQLRKGRHVVSNLHVHLVFVAKYRRRVFTKEILEHLNSVFTKICQEFESELVEFNGESDHVHLLIVYPPKVAVSKLVNSLKGVSSRKIRQANYSSISNLQSQTNDTALWSPSYFAGSCGGASIEVLRQYIEEQATPE